VFAYVGNGRVTRVCRPAGFRLKQPLKWLVCGNDERQLLADSGHLRPVTSDEKIRGGETERNGRFCEGTQNNQTFFTLSSWQVHRSTPFHKIDSLSLEQIQAFRYYG
jgi:hypothetical protein